MATQHQRAPLTIELEPELGDRISHAAAARHLSVPDYMERIVKRALELESDHQQALTQNESIVVTPLTEEEHTESLRAVADLKRIRAELFVKYGKSEPESWELLNESRDERTRDLMRALEG